MSVEAKQASKDKTTKSTKVESMHPGVVVNMSLEQVVENTLRYASKTIVQLDSYEELRVSLGRLQVQLSR